MLGHPALKTGAGRADVMPTVVAPENVHVGTHILVPIRLVLRDGAWRRLLRMRLLYNHDSRREVEWVRPPPWPHILKTPNLVSSMGALRAAEMPRPSTLRVSAGSMMPSSQRRALA
jgi:hypothetical protein